jgi:predicted transcriptional regulator
MSPAKKSPWQRLQTSQDLDGGRSTRQVNLVAEVLQGLEDAEAGRLLTTDQLLEQVDAWGA